MSKKRRQFIILPIIVLFVAGSLWITKIEWAKAYAVCRNEMLSIEGYGVWKFRKSGVELNLSAESYRSASGLDFDFDNGAGYANCSVFRDSFGWHKNGEIMVLEGRCIGCPKGKYGVSP